MDFPEQYRRYSLRIGKKVEKSNILAKLPQEVDSIQGGNYFFRVKES